ncbi:MAG: endonuclease MutS2 [Gemmataceae bacterium]
MDKHTLDLLEFDKIRDLLAGYAASSLGKELARQLEPSTDETGVRAELLLVTEMMEALGEGQTPPLSGLHDIRLLLRRAAIGSMLSAEQLLEVADTLICTGHVYRYRMRLSDRLGQLIRLLEPIEDLSLVAKTITGCIDGRGHVLDMASPELARVRQQLADVEERVQQQIRKLLRDPELRRILRYPHATVSGDHYVLPVAINHRHKIAGVVHRTSATGETVFIEPAGVARLSAERVILKGEEEREIRRILRRLTEEVARVAKPLGHFLELMARLDFVACKARFSHDYRMTAPELNDAGRLWLRQARHPLLEHLFRGDTLSPPRAVVPIDVRLGQGFNLLIITGPNTGGKTVALKTVGLLCLMAQSGLPIPAEEGSQVPLFRHILADIGDEQSLEQSLSTFSSHMSRIATILKTIDAYSLVLLDELGAGTDPTEGAALGRAILDQLDRVGCRAMVTTHLGDLKTYAFANPHAENAAVEFNTETLRPTYRLLIGQFGMSNALQIARRLRLPRDLIRRAHRYLRRRQGRAPAMTQLQRLREKAEKAREEALKAEHEAARQRAEYEAKVREVQRQADEAAALRAARAKLQPNDVVQVERFGRQGRIVRVDHKRGIALVSIGLGQWEIPLDEIFPPKT